jgi:NitT/TauT family transport system substrate-binding protein
MGRLGMAALALVLALGCDGLKSPAPATATGVESTSLKVGVVGQSQITFLPLTLAARLGYFRAEGLSVEIDDLTGSSDVLGPVLADSVDMVAGYYEHTLRAQTQGRSIEMITNFEDSPGIVLMVGKQYQEQVRSIKDMTGHPVGVTSPGSASDEMVRYLLKKENLAQDAVPLLAIGSGATAVAAITSGQVWAGVTVEPTASQLERQGSARALYDTRTAEGTLQVFGGSWPSGGFYASSDFIEKNPHIVQAMARAAVRALRYIDSHGASEITDHLPPSFFVNGDKGAFVEMPQVNLATFSDTGLMPADGPNDVLETLQAADPRTDWSAVALNRTYDNRFVQKAAEAQTGPGSARARS